MSEQVAVGLLFLFLLCIAEPILLGMCAHKIYDRAGAFWGILALLVNIGILVFLESHLRASSFFDGAAQVGIIMSLSAMSILAALELLGKGPEAPTQETSAINLRRGLFRIWAIMGGAWIVFCAIQYLDCTRYECDSFAPHDRYVTYLDIGEWFVGIPVLGYAIVLAACWVVDGFRRSRPIENGGQSLPGEPKPAIGASDERLAND